MTTNGGTSDDTLIRDSQLSGFSSFKERIGSCCCRVFKKSSNYNLSSVSKNIQEQDDKPSYINQAFQKEKKERKDKLDKIAKSLPTTNKNANNSSLNSVTQPSTRTINNKTQLTPRPGITTVQQNTQLSKTPLSNTKKKDLDQTSTGFIEVSV